MKSFVVLLAVCAVSVAADGVSFCYWGTWSIYRADKGKFGIKQIPTDLCTHLVWTFLSVDSKTADIIELEPQAVRGKYTNNIKQFVALRKKNPDLKMVVAAGGWTAGSANFSVIANDETLRATYVANTVAYLKKYGFDAFDLDIKFTQRNRNAADLKAFVLLLQDLKAAFADIYELSIAVGANTDFIGTVYNVPAISDIVDYINIMTFSYHGPWDSVTGVNAPLYDQLSDVEGTDFNVDVSVRAWLDAGVDPKKLILGIPTYGGSFHLTSLDNTGTGAPFNAAGNAGPAGSMAYYEICLDQLKNKWSITEVEGNYVYGNRKYLWVGYDNVNTAFAKGQYAKRLGLGGVMFWALDQDDFGNFCGTGKFPIINAAIDGYNSDDSPKKNENFLLSAWDWIGNIWGLNR